MVIYDRNMLSKTLCEQICKEIVKTDVQLICSSRSVSKISYAKGQRDTRAGTISP
jgi:hypothetical protein